MGSDNLKEELIGAGVLYDAGVMGLYHLSSEFESLVHAIESLAIRSCDVPRERLIYFPPLMARSTLMTTGYLRSFPNLAGSVSSFTRSERELPELMRALDADEEWTELFSPIDVVTASAACHSLYPMLQGRVMPEEGVVYEVQGTCFRHEPSPDVRRMQSFRMHELVYLGSADGALEHRDRWIEFARRLLGDLGLVIDVVEANDPFFGRAGVMLASGQRDKKLKYEIVSPIDSDTPGAIASGNYHEDHFGVSFDIRQYDGLVAHSACLGLGLERIALALMLAHGSSPERWPTHVRETLALDAIA